MSKVLTFSRVFPSYHPRKGEPTYFVEKIWNSFHVDAIGDRFFEFIENDFDTLNPKLFYAEMVAFFETIEPQRTNKFTPKYHTIRAGNRWKEGDKFSPRVWSGKPYQSKQIIIAPDIEVKKVWDITADWHNGGLYFFLPNERVVDTPTAELISLNDGLTLDDFTYWFCKAKDGEKFQIICWNENINY